MSEQEDAHLRQRDPDLKVRVALLEQRMDGTEEDLKTLRKDFTDKLDALSDHIKQNSVGAFVRGNWKYLAAAGLVMSGQSIQQAVKLLGMPV